jgi:hypothetical protein
MVAGMAAGDEGEGFMIPGFIRREGQSAESTPVPMSSDQPLPIIRMNVLISSRASTNWLRSVPG